MSDLGIEAKGLTKYYAGYPAITDISFTAVKGEIVGLLGPNGSGKSTTMRILAGGLAPTSGVARIAGWDVEADSIEARRHIGYLPENVPLYTDMTVADQLRFAGRMQGMTGRAIEARIAEVTGRFGLKQYRDGRISKLSKGFRQRVGMAQAVLHSPEVIIFDEPTIGIDPIQIVETRNIIRELGRDHTVLLSTHLLSEAAAICDRMLIIYEGTLLAEDAPEELARSLGGGTRTELRVRGEPADVLRTLERVPGVVSVSCEPEGQEADYVVEAADGAEVGQAAVRAVVEGGWTLLQLSTSPLKLEEIFMRVIRGDRPAPAGPEKLA